MLIPNDENFEELQKASAIKKITSPERPETKRPNVRAHQFKSPAQK